MENLTEKDNVKVEEVENKEEKAEETAVEEQAQPKEAKKLNQKQKRKPAKVEEEQPLNLRPRKSGRRGDRSSI